MQSRRTVYRDDHPRVRYGLYYRGSDIIAYKFLRARHCVPRDINGALKRDVIPT